MNDAFAFKAQTVDVERTVDVKRVAETLGMDVLDVVNAILRRGGVLRTSGVEATTLFQERLAVTPRALVEVARRGIPGYTSVAALAKVLKITAKALYQRCLNRKVALELDEVTGHKTRIPQASVELLSISMLRRSPRGKKMKFSDCVAVVPEGSISLALLAQQYGKQPKPTRKRLMAHGVVFLKSRASNGRMTCYVAPSDLPRARVILGTVSRIAKQTGTAGI